MMTTTAIGKNMALARHVFSKEIGSDSFCKKFKVGETHLEFWHCVPKTFGEQSSPKFCKNEGHDFAGFLVTPPLKVPNANRMAACVAIFEKLLTVRYLTEDDILWLLKDQRINECDPSDHQTMFTYACTRREPHTKEKLLHYMLFSMSVNPMQDPVEIVELFASATPEFLQKLLRHPKIDEKALFDYGAIWLKTACTNGRVETARMLLEYSNIHPEAAIKIFTDSCAKGNTEIISLLLKDARFDPSANNGEAFCAAVRGGHTDIVKNLLMDSRVQPSADSNLAIRQAPTCIIAMMILTDTRTSMEQKDWNYILMKGWAAILQHVIINCKDVDYRGDKLLQHACKIGQADVVELLIEQPSVNPAAGNNSAIRDAVYKNHLPVVRLLLADSRVDPAVNRNRPLRCACARGFAGIVELLLDDPRVDPSARKNWALTHNCEKHVCDDDGDCIDNTRGESDNDSDSDNDSNNYSDDEREVVCCRKPKIEKLLLEHVSVLMKTSWRSSHQKLYAVYRREWFERQATKMANLHMELIATIAGKPGSK